MNAIRHTMLAQLAATRRLDAEPHTHLQNRMGVPGMTAQRGPLPHPNPEPEPHPRAVARTPQ